MPIIKSAKKRVRLTRKATARNVKAKRELRSALKEFSAALVTGQKVSEKHAAAQSAVDTAVKKGLLHRNKAARKKHQLATAAKAKGKKVASKAAPKKAPAAKKPAKKA